MRRRDFLGASCAAGVVAAGGAAAGAEAPAGAAKEFLELRLYHYEPGAMRKRLDDFLALAVPAWNRLGIQPVGAFAMTDEKTPGIFVLLPHKTADSAVTSEQRLLADAEFAKAAAAFLDPPKAEPTFKRVETWLMLAFDGVPKVEVPTKKETRVFQLRTYESHSAAKALKKIEMFNAGGEIDLFRRVAMPPVFFGQTLYGSKMPNLTYMLGFDDEAAQKAAWARFLAHPDWNKLKNDPQYKDTVSTITNLILEPTAYSQI
ncbi:MAG TPA: NIPSNAP family protein [Planctomycetota bacterium]|nr:NIPSNAP family protein [Planctomycetota bacterium]